MKFYLPNQAGAFYAFCEMLLQKDIHEEHRGDGHEAGGLGPYYVFAGGYSQACVVEEGGVEYRLDVLYCEGKCAVAAEECVAYVVVVPVPHNCEQENCEE